MSDQYIYKKSNFQALLQLMPKLDYDLWHLQTICGKDNDQAQLTILSFYFKMGFSLCRMSPDF